MLLMIWLAVHVYEHLPRRRRQLAHIRACNREPNRLNRSIKICWIVAAMGYGYTMLLLVTSLALGVDVEAVSYTLLFPVVLLFGSYVAFALMAYRRWTRPMLPMLDLDAA
jgi:hypothetical protein